MSDTYAEAMDKWKELWHAQMAEGLALRRRLWECEDNVTRRRNEVHRAQEALDAAEHDAVMIRHEYELSSATAHEVFDYFRKELERGPVAASSPDTGTPQ